MVHKTRAQAAKATETSAPWSNIQPVVPLHDQLREITAYFETQSANGGPIDIDKNTNGKIDKVLDFCQKTQELVKQSSIEKLVSCIGSEGTRSRLSPEVFICLLNLLLASEPCQQRIHGLNILLDIARLGNHTLGVRSGSADTPQDTASAVLVNAVKTRLQNKSDDSDTLEILVELLTAISESPSGLTTESPLDVRVLLYAYDDDPDQVDTQNKRRRDEIPDSMEITCTFGIPPDIPVETPIEHRPDPGAVSLEPAQKESLKPSEIIPSPVRIRERPRKRRRRVTEAGSPIPIQRSSSSPTLLLHRDLPDIRQKQIVELSKKETVPNTNEESCFPSRNNNVAKDDITTPNVIPIEKGLLYSSTQQAGPIDMPREGEDFHGYEPRTGQSSVLASPRRFSALQSTSQYTDQALFDQYLDLERGTIIIGQPPENIFSSPERPVPTKAVEEDHTLRVQPVSTINFGSTINLTPAQESNTASKEWATLRLSPNIEANAKLQLEGRKVEFLHDNTSAPPPAFKEPTIDLRHDSLKSSTPALEEDINSPGADVLSQPLAMSDRVAEDQPSALLPDAHSDTFLERDATYEAQPLPACQEVDRTASVSTLQETRIKQIETSLENTRNQSRNDLTSAIVAPDDLVSDSVLSRQIRQLVTIEMEKAIKGLGAYLCNTSYQNLVLQHNFSDTENGTRRTAFLDSGDGHLVLRDLDKDTTTQNTTHKGYTACEPVSAAFTTPYEHFPVSKNLSKAAAVLPKASDAVLPIQALPETISATDIIAGHSSFPDMISPINISPQILKQIQGLKAEMIQPFLASMTLLTGAFRSLGNSEETLTNSIRRHSEGLAKQTISQLQADFDAEYQRKLLSLSSRIKAAVAVLDHLQLCHVNLTRPVSTRRDRPSQAIISLIDVALKGMTMPGSC